MEIPPPPPVAGYSLTGSQPYTISAEENEALCASIGVQPARDGTAHPIYFYIATQVGMGQTVAGLCQVCEFNVEDGPMMAGSKVTFQQPLRTGQAYEVSGARAKLPVGFAEPPLDDQVLPFDPAQLSHRLPEWICRNGPR